MSFRDSAGMTVSLPLRGCGDDSCPDKDLSTCSSTLEGAQAVIDPGTREPGERGGWVGGGRVAAVILLPSPSDAKETRTASSFSSFCYHRVFVFARWKLSGCIVQSLVYCK